MLAGDGLIEAVIEALESSEQEECDHYRQSVKTLRAGRRHKLAQTSGKYFTRPSLDGGEARRKAHLAI
jgi:hypothetical protein